MPSPNYTHNTPNATQTNARKGTKKYAVTTNLTAYLHNTLGITQRQHQNWVEQGYIRPANGRAGSGKTYQYTPNELRVLLLTARLAAVGIPPKRAAAIARRCLATNKTVAHLGHNIYLTLSLPPKNVNLGVTTP